MSTQARNNKIATIIAGTFFLLMAIVLGYVSFSLGREAEGRELNVTLADLYKGDITYGDYLTIEDTGAVISASSNVLDESGMPVGKAFLLNGMTNYIFLVGAADAFTDTSGNIVNSLNPGTLMPKAFYARVNTQTDVAPFGAEQFAIQNGLSTGQQFYVLQTGVTKGDTTVPFYITLVFAILGLAFSVGSWLGLRKKKS